MASWSSTQTYPYKYIMNVERMPNLGETEVDMEEARVPVALGYYQTNHTLQVPEICQIKRILWNVLATEAVQIRLALNNCI
jgi:hypothetical protein